MQQDMILVMGVTGAGKSYFVNKVSSREEVVVGHNLRSCTKDCQPVEAKILGTPTVLVDTPGFSDTTRTDADILLEISRILSAQYQLGLKLKGIIFLHRITDNRFDRSAFKTLDILQKICGEKALSCVSLVTTNWHDVDQELGVRRESQLRDQFWNIMLASGAQMTRFSGTKDSALAICSQVLGKEDVVLELQHELVDQGVPLAETSAGAVVHTDVLELRHEIEEERKKIQASRVSNRTNSIMKRTLSQEDKKAKKTFYRTLEDEKTLEKRVGSEIRKEIAAKRHSWKIFNVFQFILSLVSLAHDVSNTVMDASQD
ncbi:P-loop containing nucleoside triphosphate hydrolase protein [Geopyxis carbonaria]|nr:P-loop containing nucleoside triphosphate hydrolase protein [Geopyxis carbonaria]